MKTESVESNSITRNTYDAIRRSLFNCDLAPGERLKTMDLSRQFGVSLGVVREALMGLTAEGLVVTVPQRGFRAADISADDLGQLSSARIDIEVLCLRRAMEIGDLDWEAGITSALYKFTNTPKGSSKGSQAFSESYITAYADFRSALISACDNFWLLKLRGILEVQSERYRNVCAKLGPKLHDPGRGCAGLAEAVLARNAKSAIRQLEEMLAVNTSTLQAFLAKSDEGRVASK
jgi:DNA-binding GntR family transcriptional regulator